MYEGVDRILKAASILNEEGQPLVQRTLVAANEFWAAMFYYESWPPQLQMRANRIVAQILGNGPIRATIPLMDDQQLQALVDEIRNLADHLRRANLNPAVMPNPPGDAPQSDSSAPE